MAVKSKQTEMAKEASAAVEESEQDRAARMAGRTYLLDDNEWDRTDAMEYGGQADIVELEEGEVAGPFTYVGSQPMALETGDTTVHIGADPNGANMRLPISASFLRSADQARLNPGDVFLVRRSADQVKKRGKGKGQNMKIYSIKVKTRATPTASA